MFRRKDELDMDGGTQGSFLGEETETVSVLSPEKAAEYKAEYKADGAATSSVPAAKPAAMQPVKTQGASFSSPSSFGQTARPIQIKETPVTDSAPKPTVPSAPSQPEAGNTNSYRPTPVPEAPRFRPQQEAAKPTAPTQPAATPSNYNSESKKMINSKHNQNERVLTVGNDILLKGEITACDRLFIEGKVDANVSEVHTMELAQNGSFKGTAVVEFAEISGTFEGNLTVSSSLVIHQTGKVNGTISYGDIEIARGGSITGEIKAIAMSAASAEKKQKAA